MILCSKIKIQTQSKQFSYSYMYTCSHFGKIALERFSQDQCFVHLITVGGPFRIIRKWRTSSIFVSVRFLVKKIDINSEKCIEYGK